MRNRGLAQSLALSSLLALAACAGTDIFGGDRKSDTDKTTLQSHSMTQASLRRAEQGIVILGVSVRRVGLPVASPARSGGELTFLRKSFGKPVRIDLKTQPLPKASKALIAEHDAQDLTVDHFAAGLLPAGIYALASYRSAKFQWRGTAFNPKTQRPVFGGFQINPGEVLYLGSLEMWLNEPGDIPGFTRRSPRFALTDETEKARFHTWLLNRNLSAVLSTRLLKLTTRAIKPERLAPNR